MKQKIPLRLLAEQVAESAGVSTDLAQSFIKQLFQQVADGLYDGDVVEVDGLGRFSTVSDAENPVGFEPAQSIVNELNAPFALFAPLEIQDQESLESIEAVNEEVFDVETIEQSDDDAQSEMSENPIPTDSEISVTEQSLSQSDIDYIKDSTHIVSESSEIEAESPEEPILSALESDESDAVRPIESAVNAPAFVYNAPAGHDGDNLTPDSSNDSQELDEEPSADIEEIEVDSADQHVLIPSSESTIAPPPLPDEVEAVQSVSVSDDVNAGDFVEEMSESTTETYTVTLPASEPVEVSAAEPDEDVALPEVNTTETIPSVADAESSDSDKEEDAVPESSQETPHADSVNVADDVIQPLAIVPETEEIRTEHYVQKSSRFGLGFMLGLVVGLLIGALALACYAIYFVNTGISLI